MSREHDHPEYSGAEQVAIEYAERFALDHLSIDDAFFARLQEHFTDADILDLTICIGDFMALRPPDPGPEPRCLSVNSTDLDLCDPGRLRRRSAPRSVPPAPRGVAGVFLPEPDGPGFWGVFGYDDVVEVSRHPQQFGSHPTRVHPQTPTATRPASSELLHQPRPAAPHAAAQAREPRLHAAPDQRRSSRGSAASCVDLLDAAAATRRVRSRRRRRGRGAAAGDRRARRRPAGGPPQGLRVDRAHDEQRRRRAGRRCTPTPAYRDRWRCSPTPTARRRAGRR